MTEINLTHLVGKRVCVWFSDGDMAIGKLKDSGLQDSPYEFLGRSYTRSGKGGSANPTYFDIIEICAADQVTVLKWIQSADRKPTWDDAHEGFIQSCDAAGIISSCISWSTDPPPSPWTHCPGWQPPQPEPQPPSKANWLWLRQQLAEIQTQLAKMEEGQ